MARSYTVAVNGKESVNAVWCFSKPTSSFMGIKNYCCFYVRCMDACYVDDELATPQPGQFYGGWVTKDIVDPFKGGPGTMGW